jgi:dimethylhistidine N-methyltransferase
MNLMDAGVWSQFDAELDRHFAADVLGGLSQAQRAIPCTWLYDRRGSELFVEITDLPEYYPTRSEIGILRRRVAAIAAHVGPGATVVEFGSGSSRKTPLLLGALQSPHAYVPIDISAEFLIDSLAPLKARFPQVQCLPLVADFSRPEAIQQVRRALPPAGPRVGFFPGSTIGNFAPPAAVQFLRRVAAALGPQALMVIGVDSTVDPQVLIPAYDDARGVTAAFNLNLLARINRELGGNFDLAGFRHEARYDARQGRVEMHLVSRAPQQAQILGLAFGFGAGESIHTENSYKYGGRRFEQLAAEAGWLHLDKWMDERGQFGIHILRNGDAAGAPIVPDPKE